jgi:hypothetical protein
MRTYLAAICLSVLFLSAGSVYSNAGPGDNGVASGSYTSVAGVSRPDSPGGSIKVDRTVKSFARDWNYLNCSYVWGYRAGRNYVVQIVNTDGSSISWTTRSATPDIIQMAMLRACRQEGASYGVRIVNTTTGSWDAIVGY